MRKSTKSSSLPKLFKSAMLKYAAVERMGEKKQLKIHAKIKKGKKQKVKDTEVTKKTSERKLSTTNAKIKLNPPLFDVITVGSATEDVFAKSDADLITIRSPTGNSELLAYPLGSKIRMMELDFQIGGGGTNTAVSFSRLGFRTAYLGCLGKDGTARDVISLLKKENVAFIGYQEDVRTNFSVILDSMRDDRTILTYRDASNKLDYKKINKNKLRSRLVYSSSLEEQGFETIVALAEHCRKNGIMFAFNPGTYNAKLGLEGFSRIGKYLDIIILNRDEARVITGKVDMHEQFIVFRNLGIAIVAITDGKEGASLLHGTTITSTKPIPVKVVETTGAGDAFASALCAGILMKNDPVFALKLAMIQAESVIQYKGAKNILLTKKEALQRVAKDHRYVSNVRL
jgi:ribokinase